jgi:HEAT repeat protein
LNPSSSININDRCPRAVFPPAFLRRILPCTVVFCVVVLLAGVPSSSAGADTLQEAQTAFNKQHYDQALRLLDSLGKGGKAAPDVRRLTVKTLAKLGKPLEALAEYEALVPAGKPDDPALLREIAFSCITPLLRDMRDQMRAVGYSALKEIDSDETVPYLEDGLSDGSGLVRALVVEGLGRLKAGQKSARFRSALSDQAALVRVGVLKGLGRSGDRSAISVIEPALKDEQRMVQAAAAGALVMLGRAEAFAQVLKVAEAGSPEDRGAALRVLGELHDRRALPVMQEAVKDRQPSIRGAAAAALGALGAPGTSAALTTLLDDPIPAVRSSAALSLGLLGAADTVPALKKLFSDQNLAVRASAVAALLHLGRPFGEVAAVIRELSQQGEPGIRASAGRALGKAGEKDADEAVAALRVLLSDPLPRPRIAAARSLGHVGRLQHKQEMIQVLRQALRDQDEAVRATAAGSLIRWLDGKAGTGKGLLIEG